MTQTKEKFYIVKVPVYISELMYGTDEIFGGMTYSEMINKVKDKINLYNDYSENIKVGKRNKVFEKHVKKIEYFDADFKGVPGLLLKITAFNTNYRDGFFEDTERLQLTSKSKIGSDNNFVLLFPRIYGDYPSYKCQWVVLLYEDPNKENADIASTAKLTLAKIIGIEIKNVKMNSVLETLHQRKTVPELNISFTTIEYDSFDETVSFAEYLSQTRIKHIKEYVYRDIPANDAQTLVSSESFVQKGIKVVKRLFFGKHEFKVTQYLEERKEAVEKLQETIEELYNEKTQITEKDLQENLYDINFILSKFEPILNGYLEVK